MVGDCFDIDIFFGNDGGLNIMFVLFGVIMKDMFCSDDNIIVLIYYIDKLVDLLCVGKVVV